MKNLLLGMLLFMSLLTIGQTINGVPLSEIDVDYVQIVGTSNLMKTRVTIDIDFGQKQSLWKGSDTKLLDDSGSPVKLNSMIDALNFMSSSGYEFVTAYVLTTNNVDVYHYLLRKRK